MIGRLNHVAIAVPDLAAASALYRGTLGTEVSEPLDLPEHGVTTVFVTLPNTKLELLHPLGERLAHYGFFGQEPRGRHPSPLLRGGRHPQRRVTAWWPKAPVCWATASRAQAHTASP